MQLRTLGEPVSERTSFKTLELNCVKWKYQHGSYGPLLAVRANHFDFVHEIKASCVIALNETLIIAGFIYFLIFFAYGGILTGCTTKRFSNNDEQ